MNLEEKNKLVKDLINLQPDIDVGQFGKIMKQMEQDEVKPIRIETKKCAGYY